MVLQRLNIKDVGSVDAALKLYRSDEYLRDDNQFECEGCGGKCDAKRKVVITKLPEVLNIQVRDRR
jgi:ubiquitin C-terminal hydrolase